VQIYHVFLEQKLPVMLEETLLSVRRNIWFQQDGAAPYFVCQVQEHFTITYNNHWIQRSRLMAWLPRSPDLTAMHFFLWGHIKALMYMSSVDSEEDLMARIAEAAAS